MGERTGSTLINRGREVSAHPGELQNVIARQWGLRIRLRRAPEMAYPCDGERQERCRPADQGQGEGKSKSGAARAPRRAQGQNQLPMLDIEARRRLKFSAPNPPAHPDGASKPALPRGTQTAAQRPIGGTIGPKHDGVRLWPCLFFSMRPLAETRAVMSMRDELARERDESKKTPPPTRPGTGAHKPGRVTVKVPGCD